MSMRQATEGECGAMTGQFAVCYRATTHEGGTHESPRCAEHAPAHYRPTEAAVGAIRARHEEREARKRRQPAMCFGQGHADIGILLDAVMRQVDSGTILGTRHIVEVPDVGVCLLPAGTVLREVTSGEAIVEPDLADLLAKAAGRIFEPTPEEVAGCAVLAEVAGKTEREAVVWLARRLEEMTWKRNETAGRVIQVGKERDALKRQRPRVGPWVAQDEDYETRIDGGGHIAGSIHETDDGWAWWAVVPYAQRRHGGEGEGLTKEQARATVDAVLRESFDLGGGDVPPNPNALTAARTPEMVLRAIHGQLRRDYEARLSGARPIDAPPMET